jgi:hypothetical protein
MTSLVKSQTAVAEYRSLESLPNRSFGTPQSAQKDTW